ncbi:MAG TPA: N-6 DNA methylase [Ktedonobacteraceae bacterium]
MKHGVHSALAPDWYEVALPSRERKQRGHFSTPHALVDQILDACGYTPAADLRQLRVLDPACGSGNFLARAALRLCRALQAQGLKQEEIHRRVYANLWGLDPDPVACCLAEMQVRSALESARGVSDKTPPLHIHQVDSLALAWQPCVDLLVANPPYLATKNTDLSHYRQTKRRGQADSYLLFVELALRAVRPGGWIGLIVPDPVLARANAAAERASLLRECTIQHLWHLAGVFSAEVGAVVIVAHKIPPRPLHQVSWERTRWRTDQRLYETARASQGIEQELLASQPGAELRYLLGGEQGRVSERLRRALDAEAAPSTGQARLLAKARLLPLNALVDIKRGEEIGRASSLLEPLAALKDGLPVLRGGVDLRPYTLQDARLGIERSAISKPISRYMQPKLLVVKSTERLQAALDTRGHVVLQTLYLLQLHEQAEDLETAYFLLALLNSRFLSAYVHHLYTAYKLVQPQIEQAVLARLPVAWGSASERAEIATRARALAQACSQVGRGVEWNEFLSALYEEQERAVCLLYAQVFSQTKESP